jgi:hypothetical protein
VRLPSGRKVVVGRYERENELLETCGVAGVLLTTVDHPGPTTLVPGNPAREEIEQAARITAGYSDGRHERAVRVAVRRDGGQGAGGKRQESGFEVLTVEPMPREEIKSLMV